MTKALFILLLSVATGWCQFIVNVDTINGVIRRPKNFIETNHLATTQMVWAAVLGMAPTTNDFLSASNALYTSIVANGGLVSNGCVAFTMAASNNLYGSIVGNGTIVSNGAVAFTMTTSNTLYGSIVANGSLVSNGCVAFTMTASNTLYGIVGNKISDNLGIGTNTTIWSGPSGTPTLTLKLYEYEASDVLEYYWTNSVPGYPTNQLKLWIDRAGNFRTMGSIVSYGTGVGAEQARINDWLGVGTNLFASNSILSKTIIASNVMATNFFLNNDGQYIDLFPLTYSGGPAVAAPQRVIVQGHQVYGLGWDTSDETDYTFQLPHNISQTNAYCSNVILFPHIHLIPTNTISGSATNVKMVFKWLYCKRNAAPTMFGTNTVQVGMTGAMLASGGHGYFPMFSITNNNAVASDELLFNVSRVAADSNDVAGRIIVHFDIHVPVGNTHVLGTP